MNATGAVSPKQTNDRLRVMTVDDERIVGERLKVALSKHGLDVTTHVDPEQARQQLADTEYDIVVTDLRMDEVDGIQILEHAISIRPQTRVILITGYASVDVAREALSKGAFDFIAKPFTAKDLRAVIHKAALSLGHKGLEQTDDRGSPNPG